MSNSTPTPLFQNQGQLLDDVVTAAGASVGADPAMTSYWKALADALEVIAGGSTTANASLTGYLYRSAIAAEAIAGASTSANNNNQGYLMRIVNAAESLAGVSDSSLMGRLLAALPSLVGGGPPPDGTDGQLSMDFSRDGNIGLGVFT